MIHDILENGTVDPTLQNYATKYAISTSDVNDTLPGSVTFTSYNEGASIVDINIGEKTICIDKDWANRRCLSNQKQIILKKDNITKILTFIKIYSVTISSLPATKIVFGNDVTEEDLEYFTGPTGIAFLNLYPQNSFGYNNLSSDYTIVKGSTATDVNPNELFSVTFSWNNNYNVVTNTLRWREVGETTTWNYVDVDPHVHACTVGNFNKYIEYEWQVYSAIAKKENFTSYSAPLKFKFF